MQASATAATLLSMLDDYDRLLSSDSNFMLGEHHHWPIPDSAPKSCRELQRCHADLRSSLGCVVTPISTAFAGPWIKWARSWSDDKEEQDFFEFNASRSAPPFSLRLLSKASKEAAVQARNQITLWGPTGQINDCAPRKAYM